METKHPRRGHDAGPSPRQIAVLAERIDADNWLDEFDAAPAGVCKALALKAVNDGGLAMVSSAIPFSHFNMVLTLGCPAAVNDAAFSAIDRFYAGAPAGKHWILVNDLSEPADLSTRLERQGYRQSAAWDRAVLLGPRPDLWKPHAAGCEFVGEANKRAWSDFLLKCYGMPAPIADWLHALVGRPGWTHALRRKDGRPDGPVVMVRSLFAKDGWAWLGIDAPIPGVMAPCYDDDRAVVATLLEDAAAKGARSFVSDVEMSNPARTGPQYDYWRELGFGTPYLRRVYVSG